MSSPASLIEPAVGSISRSTVRPTVDLPQPDSPTRPSVSPAAVAKLTPSTANTWPAVRRRRPVLMGKCFLRPATSSTGASGSPAGRGSGIGRSIERVGAPAGGPVSGPLLLIGRILPAAALVGERAARREGAGLRQIGQRRNHAWNLLEAAIGPLALAAHQRQARDRGEQAVGV